MITRRRLLGGSLAGTLAWCALRGRLSARAAPDRLALGEHELKLDYVRDGRVYLPERYEDGDATPLLVMLHGAGSTSMSARSLFPLADEFGVIILAPDSRDERTWDAILGSWGPDVEFLGTAVRSIFARCTVDRQRMGLAGISDGASYALSLGIGAGDDFGRILAFSPGVMQPTAVRGKPRIFISHGTSDRVMPIDDTSRTFVPRLRALGYDVTYREFDGGHTLPRPVAHEAFEWFLQR